MPPPYGAAYGAPPVRKPWLVEVPPGRPYHQMARTRAQRWWRPLAGTAGIAAAGLFAMLPILLAWLLVEALVTGDGLGVVADRLDDPNGPLTGDGNAGLTFILLSVVVFLPFIPLAARVFQRRRPGTLSSVIGRLRWRWLGACAGLSVLISILSFGLAWPAGLVADEPVEEGSWVGWGAFLAPVLIVLALVPFQAACEEYFFRGWLLQAIGSCTLEGRTGAFARRLSAVFRTPWPGILIGGAAFTSLHAYTGWAILAIFSFGVVAGWVTVRTGGLEAAIAIHVVNNIVAFLVPAAFGTLDLEQGDIPWPYVIADVTPLLLYAVIVIRLADRRRLETVTRPEGTPGPADPTR